MTYIDELFSNIQYCIENMKLLHFDISLMDALKKYSSNEDLYEYINYAFEELLDEDMDYDKCRSSHGYEYGKSFCAICHMVIYGTDIEFHEIHYHTCIDFLGYKLCICDNHILIDPITNRITNKEEFIKHFYPAICVEAYFQRRLSEKFPNESLEIAELISNALT